MTTAVGTPLRCELCPGGLRSARRSVPLRVGSRSRIVHLCDRHLDQLNEATAAFLNLRGVAPAPRAPLNIARADASLDNDWRRVSAALGLDRSPSTKTDAA